MLGDKQPIQRPRSDSPIGGAVWANGFTVDPHVCRLGTQTFRNDPSNMYQPRETDYPGAPNGVGAHQGDLDITPSSTDTVENIPNSHRQIGAPQDDNDEL